MATNNAVNTSLTGQTGTGNFVGQTSPTLVTPNIGIATAQSISFTTVDGIIGETNGLNPAFGSVGEVISSVVLSSSVVGISNGVAADVTSITLTAGNWDVWGNVTLLSTLGMGSYEAWINDLSATMVDSSRVSALSIISQSISNVGTPVPSLTFNLSTPTTIYLSVLVGFTSGTCGACGGIYARRRC